MRRFFGRVFLAVFSALFVFFFQALDLKGPSCGLLSVAVAVRMKKSNAVKVAVAVLIRKPDAVAVAVARLIRKPDAVAVAVAVQIWKIKNRN